MELRNEAGSVALVYRGYRCWPSEYIPLGDLRSTEHAAVATESITLQCEAWDRDVSIPEPQEN